MQTKYAEKGFTVVSVTFDENPKEAGAFAKEVKATFPVIQDAKMAVFGKFKIEPVPSNVVVDRSGKVVAAIEGADIKTIEAAITKALAAK